MAGMTGLLYYGTVLSFLWVWPLWLWYYRQYEEDLLHKKEMEFLGQFKDMIQSLSASLNVGYSLENALRESYREMQGLYGENARISRELRRMDRQLRLQIPAESVFEEFAERVQTEDVLEFSSVFTAAKRSGGNMISIIQNTIHQMGEKMDVTREIETVIAAKKYEFQIMAIIPYGMIGYMVLSFPDFMSTLYGNLLGGVVMTVCLGVYLAAYRLGVKMVKIEV